MTCFGQCSTMIWVARWWTALPNLNPCPLMTNEALFVNLIFKLQYYFQIVNEEFFIWGKGKDAASYVWYCTGSCDQHRHLAGSCQNAGLPRIDRMFVLYLVICKRTSIVEAKTNPELRLTIPECQLAMPLRLPCSLYWMLMFRVQSP